MLTFTETEITETEITDQIIQATTNYIKQYNTMTGRTISIATNHRFNLKGQTAGQFCHSPTEHYFRWNMTAAGLYLPDYLKQTVGHEVAHYIVSKINTQAPSHGQLWKLTMNQLGLEATRCHSYKLAKARTTVRPWKYICACGVKMFFTMQKYQNMIKRGLKMGGDTYYACRNCDTYINIIKIKHLG